MKAYKHLVKHSLATGHVISVWDGEEYQVKRSTSYRAIVAAIESVEEAQINIRDKEGKEVGWALIIPFGLEDDETVVDNTLTPFMDAWDDTYYAFN
jgi:hypothetical protein